MGSKSSNAPPPDPRLIEAQIKSMGIQDDAIQRIMGNAERLQPLQEEQMQFAIDTARQGVTDAKDDRAWMLTRRAMLSGVQDQLSADAQKFNQAQRTDELAQEAGADANAAIANARAQSARSMARRGVSPFSGAAATTQADLGAAALLAGAKNTARRSARAEGYALTDRAANALAGYPAMSAAASGQGAAMAASGLNLANAGAAGVNAGYATGAQVAGQMGANATSMWGAQANYKAQQDQIAASSDPFNTILGAAAGIGTQWALGSIKNSDRRLKTDIERVGVDERTGLALYEFAYLNDASGKRYRGVMADEVERFDRDAVIYDDLGFASVDYARLGIEMVEV